MKKLSVLFLLLIWSIHCFPQSDPEQLIEEFFRTYQAGKPNEAIDNLYASNAWKNDIQESITNLKETFASLEGTVGKYNGHLLIAKRDLVGTYIIYSYLVKYERQPIRFYFEFYKPSDTWHIYSFSFDDDVDDELAESMKIQNLNGNR